MTILSLLLLTVSLCALLLLWKMVPKKFKQVQRERDEAVMRDEFRIKSMERIARTQFTQPAAKGWDARKVQR